MSLPYTRFLQIINVIGEAKQREQMDILRAQSFLGWQIYVLLSGFGGGNSQPHSYQKWLEIVGLEKPAPKMTAEQEKAFESHILEKFQNLLNLRNDLSSGNQEG
jgi:hypothetical protein